MGQLLCSLGWASHWAYLDGPVTGLTWVGQSLCLLAQLWWFPMLQELQHPPNAACWMAHPLSTTSGPLQLKPPVRWCLRSIHSCFLWWTEVRTSTFCLYGFKILCGMQKISEHCWRGTCVVHCCTNCMHPYTKCILPKIVQQPCWCLFAGRLVCQQPYPATSFLFNLYLHFLLPSFQTGSRAFS